jgi:hypothetical protein
MKIKIKVKKLSDGKKSKGFVHGAKSSMKKGGMIQPELAPCSIKGK